MAFPLPRDIRRFQAGFATVLGYLNFLTGDPGFAQTPRELDEMAHGDMVARERTLYVEVAPTGNPMTPEGVVEEDAIMWMEGMAKMFAGLARTWRSSLDDALAEAEATPGV